MKFEDFLCQIGLSQRAAKIYVALLSYGDLSLSELSVKTHINRVALYEILPGMVEEGYLQKISRGRRSVYRSTNPERLELLFESQKRDFDKNISKLKKMYGRSKKRPVITFREGSDGVRETFDDVGYTMPNDGTYYRYSSRISNDVSEDRSEKYFAMRNRKRLGRYVITGEAKGRGKKSDMNRLLKTIPPQSDLFDDDVSLLIYANKVAFVDHENKLTFTIESEKIATFQRKIFMLLFKRL